MPDCRERDPLASLRCGLLARPWLALATALVVQTALFLAVQRDLTAADPLSYAIAAHDLTDHSLRDFAARDNHPFTMRLGLTAPLSLLYRAFGVSTLVTNLPCLLAGLAIIAIACAAMERPRAKLLAVAFALACTPMIADARELNPDLPCAAVMALSLLCLARRDRRHGAWWATGAMVAWFAAFQIKEVALWCAPVWLYAAIADLRLHGVRRVARTFAPPLAVGAALTAGYLACCAVLWGDPLARFTGTEALHHAWTLNGEPGATWVARLTWQPAVLLFKMFGVALVPVVLSPWLVRERDRIWVVACAAIVLLYWFGSTKATAYSPLPIYHRMVLPALPSIVVVSALATDAAIDRFCHASGPAWLMLGLALWLVIAHVHWSYEIVAATERPEQAAYAALRDEVVRRQDRIILVCGDPRCPLVTRFYFGFEPPANLAVVTAPAFATAPPPEHATVRLMVNVERMRGAGKDIARRAEALGLAQIAWHNDVRLYDAGDGVRLHEALAPPP